LAPLGVVDFRHKPFVILFNPMSLLQLGHPQDALGATWNNALELFEGGRWRERAGPLLGLKGNLWLTRLIRRLRSLRHARATSQSEKHRQRLSNLAASTLWASASLSRTLAD